MSSLGNFIALSEKCDELTARLISREISEGVVAPDYDSLALNILAKKKSGNYVILKVFLCIKACIELFCCHCECFAT